MSAANLASYLKFAEPLRSIAIPGNPSIQTRHRWALTGVLAPDGHRVKLQTWRVGGRVVSTPEAVEQFLLAINGDAPASEADTAAARRRGHDVDQAMEALGL